MIRIIQGVYGYKQGLSVIPKTIKDEPFTCAKEEEARLVKLGVAEYVDEVEAVETKAAEEDAVTEPTEATEPTEEETEEEAVTINLDEMNFAELKDFAKENGATDEDLKPLKSKDAVKKLIEKLLSDEAEEVEDAPDFSEVDGVVE